MLPHRLVSINRLSTRLLRLQTTKVRPPAPKPQGNHQSHRRATGDGNWPAYNLGHHRQGQRLGDEQGQAEVPPTRVALTTPETEVIKAAVERSHLTDVSVRAMERMQLVRNAPQTQERIRSGEIKTVGIAEREALKELGQDPQKDILPAQLMKPFRALGQAIYKLEMAHTGLAGGTDDVDQILHRIQAIRELLDRTEGLVTIKSETGEA